MARESINTPLMTQYKKSKELTVSHVFKVHKEDLR